MERKKIKIFGNEYEYTEHKGIIQFPSLCYIKMFDKEENGDPELEAIYLFDRMGYALISTSFIWLYFKKRKNR